MILSELVNTKVVVHVTTGSTVTQHRGILLSIDQHAIKLQKDNELIYFMLSSVVGLGPV